MTYGRTCSEQRFSPLARITTDNVKQLGLAWYADLDTAGPSPRPRLMNTPRKEKQT